MGGGRGGGGRQRETVNAERVTLRFHDFLRVHRDGAAPYALYVITHCRELVHLAVTAHSTAARVAAGD